MKYYHTQCANHRIKSQGFRFQFESYEMLGGAWKGVYATESPEEIEAMNAAVKSTPAITEITQAEYEACKKKAVRPSPGFGNWNPAQPALGNPAVPAVESNAPVELDAIQTAKVAPAQPPADALVPIRRRGPKISNPMVAVLPG